MFGCCAAAIGQGQIFVVDAFNGPGASFTSLQTAVLSVPDGSTLLVRNGSYAPVLVDGKGLAILGDSGVIITNPTASPFLEIRNTQANQPVVVRGLKGGLGSSSSFSMLITNAAGPVTLDGVAVAATYAGQVLTVTGSTQVDVRNWTMGGLFSTPVLIDNSVVVFERCNLFGSYAGGVPKGGGFAGMPALIATNSQVQLIHSIVRGGNGVSIWRPPPWVSYTLPGAPAVQLQASALRAIGFASHLLWGGTGPGAPQLPAIVGNGSARVDPLITMAGPVAPGIALQRPTMPSLLAGSAAPGGVLTIERFGAPNVWCVVATSLRGPSSALPGVLDPIWIGAAGVLVDAVMVPASGAFMLQRTVPNVPTLRGLQFVWQSGDVTAAGLVEVSNPSPSFVR
jgi:hypothetical protein